MVGVKTGNDGFNKNLQMQFGRRDKKKTLFVPLLGHQRVEIEEGRSNLLERYTNSVST